MHIKRVALGISFWGVLLNACGGPDDYSLTSESKWNPVYDMPRGQATRYPILFANGIISPSKTLYPVLEALKDDGHRVFITTPPAVESIEERAHTVAKVIDEVLAQSAAEKLNIIAYSAGGLDARAVISSLGYADRVASVTMLGVPNRGAPLAEALLEGLQWIPSFFRPILNKLAIPLLYKQNPDLKEANVYPLVYDLSLRGTRSFNEMHPDKAGVYYQTFGTLSAINGENPKVDSWLSADCEGQYFGRAESLDRMNSDLAAGMSFLKLHFLRFPKIIEKASDGTVTLESQKWGEFRGCIPADHYDLLNINRGPDRDLAFDADDPATGFNPIRFYRNISFDLQRLGF